jgi:hypothetical protein
VDRDWDRDGRRQHGGDAVGVRSSVKERRRQTRMKKAVGVQSGVGDRGGEAMMHATI